MPPPLDPCLLCETSLDDREPGEGVQPIHTPGGLRHAHQMCMLRSVLGGIGHLTNHAYWCSQAHDPDAGMTWRESAQAVDHWVRAHGTDTAAAVSTAGRHEGADAAL